jgi:hypothetical protein
MGVQAGSDLYKHLDRGDGVCIYFDCSTKLCSIYDERPIICRIDDYYEKFYRNDFTLQEFYEENYKACENLKKMEDIKMSDIKSALKGKFEEIFGYAPGDDYAPRVSNAREIICQGKYRKDDLIDITDTSISSNGKSGLVLTVDSVCVKDSANSTSKFIARYEDIDYTYMNEDRFLGMDITALELNMKYGAKYRISIDAINKEKLMEFIDYAISLYQEDEKLEW